MIHHGLIQNFLYSVYSFASIKIQISSVFFERLATQITIFIVSKDFGEFCIILGIIDGPQWFILIAKAYGI